MKVLLKGGQAEIVEKKSRFIAELRTVHSEDEANAFLMELRKQYWDASHNCSAYVLAGPTLKERCSDDGEPQGTAGRPMLQVLREEELTDAMVIVTRYFGGTLLGTGGLVRAYTKAVQEGLKACRVAEKKSGRILSISTDYNGVGKIQYILGKRSLPILDSEYADSVKLSTIAEEDVLGSLQKEITEATAGRAGLELSDLKTYALDGGSPVFLD